MGNSIIEAQLTLQDEEDKLNEWKIRFDFEKYVWNKIEDIDVRVQKDKLDNK